MDIEKILSELTLEEKASLCSGRDYWHTKAVERLDVPEMMMCDGPHGLRKQVGEGDHLGINESIETVCYPTASALAASFDREVLHTLGETLGKECQAENVGMLLGPGVNMKRSPLCGRNFEYFSEDPYLAGELGTAYVQGLQEEGIAACVKHFAANNQETRRMSGTSNLDERTLHETYLPAFENIVKKGNVRGVMCAYNAVNGTACAENKELLTEILREQWGYDGMVVTDWGAVKDRVEGLKAGLDLEMPGGPGAQDKAIVEAVKSGKLEEEVLDKAVRNILKLVANYQEQRRPDAVLDRSRSAEVSRNIAEQCAVLLKNNGALPLNTEDEAVFIGEFAEKPRYQGAGSSHINVPCIKGAAERAQEAGYPVTWEKGYQIHSEADEEENEVILRKRAVEAARRSFAAVIFAGQPDAYETEGCDRDTMQIPENQNRLIEAVAAVQPNTVVVLHGGAVMELPWLEQVSAVLCMYLGGQEVGAASVNLLYGKANPSGKLADTWPLKVEDNPSYLNFPGEEGKVEYREGIYIGYRYYDKKKMQVCFPFGYGLSYTTFAFSDLKLDKETMTDREILTASCKIKNTGNRKGKETVQLYVRDETSTVGRPVRELKGFEKVELEPGEEKTVSFSLDKRAFAYYEPKIHDWFVESGRFFIEIGASSREILLSAPVEVTGTKELPLVYSYDSTVGDLMKTEKGRALMSRMMAGGAAEGQKAAEEDNLKHMGEGSEKMVQNMMIEMPLRSIVTFGRMTEEQLDGMIRMLNEP